MDCKEHSRAAIQIYTNILINCLTLQVIVFERGDLVFVFNFHPENTYEGYSCFI